MKSIQFHKNTTWALCCEFEWIVMVVNWTIILSFRFHNLRTRKLLNLHTHTHTQASYRWKGINSSSDGGCGCIAVMINYTWILCRCNRAKAWQLKFHIIHWKMEVGFSWLLDEVCLEYTHTRAAIQMCRSLVLIRSFHFNSFLSSLLSSFYKMCEELFMPFVLFTMVDACSVQMPRTHSECIAFISRLPSPSLFDSTIYELYDIICFMRCSTCMCLFVSRWWCLMPKGNIAPCIRIRKILRACKLISTK